MKQELYRQTIEFLLTLDCCHFTGVLTLEECAELLVFGYVEE